MTTHITLEHIEEATEDLPLLGYTVFWALGGIRVPHADLKQALAKAGFADYLPDPPTARIALRRAIVDWIAVRAAQGQGPALATGGADDAVSGPTTQRALLRVINQKTSEWMAFALIAEDVDFEKLGLQYGTSLRLLLHKTKKTFLCTSDAVGVPEATAESAQITREIGPYWTHYSTLHVSGDLSRMMRNIVAGRGAISLRREGGLYFLPVGERAALERLRGLLGKLPHTAGRAPYFCALGVLDRAQAKRQLAQAVHGSFLDELGVMRTDLQRFLDAKTSTVKSQTIAERLMLYKQIKAKAQTYADLLGMQQDRILTEIDELTDLARTIVLQDGAAADTSAAEEQTDGPPETDEMQEVELPSRVA